jgi:aminomethyltransferase
MAVRNCAGLFDVSHMGELIVRGKEAKQWLNSQVTNDLELLRNGKAIYTLICNDDGGVIDDVIVYQRAADDLLICVNAANRYKDAEWLRGRLADTAVELQDVSDDWGQLAVQGPAAWKVLLDLCDGLTPADIPQRFRFIEIELLGVPTLVSRTGYTGEDGFELYLPMAAAPLLAEGLARAGKQHGLIAAGLGARDSLRLEAGYPLFGHEISEAIDPLTAGLGWAVKLAKPGGFTGQKALRDMQSKGLGKAVRYFVLEDRRIARAGTPVLGPDGSPCGEVLSGTLSPVLNQPIGSALINCDALSQEGTLSVDIRGNSIPLKVRKPPLHIQ